MGAPYNECDFVLELWAVRESYLDQSAEVTVGVGEAECGLVVGCLDNATEDSGW